MAEPVIGIDLGTTNSVVATVQSGTPVVIANRSGYRLTPSVVAVAKNGKRLGGALARRQGGAKAERAGGHGQRLVGGERGPRSTPETPSRPPPTPGSHQKEGGHLAIPLRG